MNNIKLIKEINNSLKPVDPVAEAIRSIDSEIDDESFSPTDLDDEQLDTLVDYMREMIGSATSKGQPLTPEGAAAMALEDVAGFETAPTRVTNATVRKLVALYKKQHGR